MSQEANGRGKKGTPEERLKEILGGRASVGALNAYFDQAINRLTELIAETRSAYEKSAHYDASLEAREKEDRAFVEAGLPDVSTVLDTLVKKRDAYRGLTKAIVEQRPDPDLVFLPGNGERIVYAETRPKREAGKEAIERAEALAFVLAELGLTEKDIGGALVGTKEAREGKKGYTVVDLPTLNRAVLVSDEHAQATYVIDTNALRTLTPPLVLEDVIQLSKDDLRKLLEENKDKGVGVWLRFAGDSWMERLKEALISPDIGKEDIELPDDETRIIDTNGPWEGFAGTDGLHFGTPEAIRKRLKNEEKREESLALVASVCKKLAGIPVTDPRVIPRGKKTGYAYEEFIAALHARDQLPKVDRATGMALVGSDKTPYMSLDVLAKHLDRSQDAIESLAKKHTIPPVRILDRYNREADGYPVERLRDLSHLTMSLPQVETKGTEEVPKGFILVGGVLYGLVKEISRRLHVSESSINQAIDESEASDTPLPSTPVRDYANNPRTAYSLPAIESHPIVSRILKAEQADADGWLRRDGKTYGTIPKIAEEIKEQGLSTLSIKQLRNNLGYLANRREQFKARPARIPNVRPVQDVYCLEDIIAYLKRNP